MASFLENLSMWMTGKKKPNKPTAEEGPAPEVRENLNDDSQETNSKVNPEPEVIQQNVRADTGIKNVQSHVDFVEPPNDDFEQMLLTKPKFFETSTPRNIDERNKLSLNEDHDGSKSSQNRSADNSFNRERKPQKYSGNTDWKDYIRQFQAVAKWNAWDETKMGLQLAMSLSDEALEVWGSLDDEKCYDYQVLVDVLTRRFCPEGNESQYSLELMNRVCQQEESVTSFGHALRRLASRAYPGHPVQEEILINLYMKGLPNKEMKRHVYLAKPKSLSEAINLAVSFEAFEKPLFSGAVSDKIKKPKAVIAAVQGSVDKKKNVPDSNTNENVSPNDLTQLTKVMSKMDQTLKQLGESIKNQSKVTNEQRVHRNNRAPRDISTVECYRCHNKGHYAKECPTNTQQNNQSQAGGQTVATAPQQSLN